MASGDGVVYRSGAGRGSEDHPFARLRSALERQGSVPRSARRRKAGPKGTNGGGTAAAEGFRKNSEGEAFREAMEGVREIPEFRRLPVGSAGSAPAAPRQRRRERGDEALRELVAGKDDLDLSLIDEYVEWRRPDQPKDLARRLHRGDFSVQDALDLHGMNRDEAVETLSSFLVDVRRRGLSCVKIIHGRGLRSPGEPVLRSAVREWLLRGPHRKRVRAFSTARGRDGGLGAVYVLFQK